MITRKSNDRVRMWAPPEFRKKIKMEAAARDISMDDFLRQLASEGRSVEEYFKKQKDKKDWRFNL